MLGPILLAALVARCFGSLAGLVALTAFLYRIPRGPTGATPFYSTLLYSGNFAQALFYLTLLAYVGLAEKHRLRYVLTGLLLGLTFLGHAAPFLVLLVLFLVEFARAATRDPRTALKVYALLFGTAALAAMPLLVSSSGATSEILNPRRRSGPLVGHLTAIRRQIDHHTWAARGACRALMRTSAVRGSSGSPAPPSRPLVRGRGVDGRRSLAAPRGLHEGRATGTDQYGARPYGRGPGNGSTGQAWTKPRATLAGTDEVGRHGRRGVAGFAVLPAQARRAGPRAPASFTIPLSRRALTPTDGCGVPCVPTTSCCRPTTEL
jgi:hypothetical protein